MISHSNINPNLTIRLLIKITSQFAKKEICSDNLFAANKKRAVDYQLLLYG